MERFVEDGTNVRERNRISGEGQGRGKEWAVEGWEKAVEGNVGESKRE